MPVQVKVLFNKLPGAPGKLRSWSGRVTQQSAERVVKRAKELCPVDSGELRDHIEQIQTGPFTRVVQSTRPSTDGAFDVPSFIEYKRQAYLRPALEEERGPFLDAIDRIIDGLV